MVRLGVSWSDDSTTDACDTSWLQWLMRACERLTGVVAIAHPLIVSAL